MNVQPINQNKPVPSFKQVYPVMHCVQVGDNLYKITADMTLIKKLQRKLVRMLNKPEEYYFDFFGKNPLENAAKGEFEEIEAKNIEQKVREFFGWKDIDYRGARENLKLKIRKLMARISNLEAQGFSASKEKEELSALKDSATLIRSFYNETNGDVKNGTWPSFLISGLKYIKDFMDECSAKNIGRFKGIAKKNKVEVHTEETKAAINNYNELGYKFVSKPENRMTDNNGVSYYLRAIFEAIRNKKGKIKDYKLIRVEFLPTGKTAPNK